MELLTQRLAMKTVCMFCVFILCQICTHAQDWSQLPELPVWYELENTSFGKNMTYLPDFDTARGGFNALTHYIAGQQNPTWYNRYKGDTENMFQWSTTFYDMITGDFNGDGINDYMGGTGEVYQGVKISSPPKLPHVAGGYPTGYGSYIFDFDNDGKYDVIKRNNDQPDKNGKLGSIIFGNSDLTKMQVVALPHTSDSTDCILDAYTNNGKARMITLAVDESNKSAKLVLWEIRFITAGSKISVEYIQLYSKQVPYSSAIDSRWSFTVHDKDLKMINILDDVYLINENGILTRHSQSVRPYINLNHIIQSNVINEYIAIGDINNPDINKRPALFVRGNPYSDSIPYARLYRGYYNSSDDYLTLTNAVSVGDINNDGFSDIATYYDGWKTSFGITKFVIYLGIDKSVGVTEQPQNTISFNLQSNNPIARTGKLQVTIKAHPHTSLTLMLYDMRGAQVAELWKGLATGLEQQLALDISTYHLSTGMYNLRLQSGAQFTDKAIIIE